MGQRFRARPCSLLCARGGPCASERPLQINSAFGMAGLVRERWREKIHAPSLDFRQFEPEINLERLALNPSMAARPKTEQSPEAERLLVPNQPRFAADARDLARRINRRLKITELIHETEVARLRPGQNSAIRVAFPVIHQLAA